jgi:HAD superfamily hydrolase (TIGR01450 family)
VVDKARDIHGYTEIRCDQVYTSGYITGHYLKENVIKNLAEEKVLLIGENGFKREVEAHGIAVCDFPQEDTDNFSDEELTHFRCDPSVKAVVVGIDYNFTYRKLCIASLYIQNGCSFIASNKDRNSGTGDMLVPGGGTIVKALETASGVAALVMGKPSKYAMELIRRDHNIPDGAKILMIGDNLETDIMFGNVN